MCIRRQGKGKLAADASFSSADFFGRASALYYTCRYIHRQNAGIQSPMMPAYDRLIYRYYVQAQYGRFMDSIHDFYKKNEINRRTGKESCV